MTKVVGGYVDLFSGQKCGWANGLMTCAVPECKFPDCRCLAVKRERGEA